jgi:CRP-like cAMP-binding protein
LDDVTSFAINGKSGDTIFLEGETGTEMYIIQKGEIEIVKTYGTETSRLALLEVGDFFGEMSLLEEMPRDASALALTDYRLIRIDHSTFDQMVQENPEIAVRMLRKLSRRLRERQEADLKAAQIAQDVLEEPEEPTGPFSVPSEEPSSAVEQAVLVHELSGARFQLSETGDTTVGRRDRVTGFSPEIDFTDLDNHRTLSRRHAKLSRSEEGYFVREEIGTGNGTWVNGKRIKTGVPVRLKDGDEIQFGLLKTVFRSK